MLGSKLSQLAIKHIENKYNGYVVNVVQASKSGTADLICCIKGGFYAFEIKGDGDILTPLQKIHLEKVELAGGTGREIRSLSAIDRLLL